MVPSTIAHIEYASITSGLVRPASGKGGGGLRLMVRLLGALGWTVLGKVRAGPTVGDCSPGAWSSGNSLS